MPQRQFWATQHPVRFKIDYSVDLSKPNGCPKLTFAVYDQGGDCMSIATCLVPPTVLDEAVPSLFEVMWGAYLYGDPNDQLEWMRSLRKAVDAWIAHANQIEG